MKLLLENWYLIVGGVACVGAITFGIYKWLHLPTTTQIENLKEWLKYGVLESERLLGSGTGQAKLRYVYDLAIAKFKWLSFVPFETFSSWVDEALHWLESQLDSNESIKGYVKGV